MTELDLSKDSASIRRVFRYGDHVFDDPGREYTVEQVRQALLPYFPELAHATADEETLEDGTLQVTFRKQITTKGSNTLDLIARLERLAGGEDPAQALLAWLGEPDGSTTCSLRTVLDHSQAIEAAAGQIQDRAEQTARMVQGCRQLSPSVTDQVPLGF